MTFKSAKQLYYTIAAMKDSVEDGLYEMAKDFADEYRESNREDDDKAAFVAGIKETLDYYGYPYDEDEAAE